MKSEDRGFHAGAQYRGAGKIDEYVEPPRSSALSAASDRNIAPKRVPEDREVPNWQKLLERPLMGKEMLVRNPPEISGHLQRSRWVKRSVSGHRSIF